MRAAILLAILAACDSPKAAPDAPASPWSMGAALPLVRIEPGVTALGQQVVVLGGFDTGQAQGLDVTKRVDVYDVASDQWNLLQLPDEPVARHHAQIAAIGATLYLLGGLDGTPDAQNNFPARGDTYRLDALTPGAQWEPLASIPSGFERGSAAVIIAPPRIYLFGGAGTTTAIADNIYYDTTQDTWTVNDPTIPPLPAPRSHPAGMRRGDGTFVIAGGLSGLTSDTQVNDVWQLPPTTGATWAPMTAMPTARGGCAYGVVAGQLACAGGEAGTSALKTTELYDPYTDTWTSGADMPASTAGTQGAGIGTRLFVPGGSRTVPTITISFEPTDTLYIFTAL